jgi:putative redox protein
MMETSTVRRKIRVILETRVLYLLIIGGYHFNQGTGKNNKRLKSFDEAIPVYQVKGRFFLTSLSHSALRDNKRLKEFIKSMNQLKAQIKLIDEKVRMEASVSGRPSLIMDYPSPIGNGDGYTSLEVLLVSLASCYGTTVKSMITGHLKKEVRDLSIQIEGERSTDHPTKFNWILLSLKIASPDLSLEELTSVSAMAEEKYCPVWAMIKGNAELERELTIGR